jgi:hypothetical protein
MFEHRDSVRRIEGMLYRSVVALVGVTLLTAAWVQRAEAQQLTACTSNCANVMVGGDGQSVNPTVTIPITFTQAPNDNQQGSGNDDTAAIAFTLGLGDDDSPLALNDCADDDGDGLPDSVTPAGAIAPMFRVVVENAFCTNRNRCLCPTEGTQTRDRFVNIVVYGPKELPTTGPVAIPRLPSGELLSVTLRADPRPSTQTEETLVLFAETDLTRPKPQFGAYLSIGDQAAVDQTANRGTNVSKVTVGAPVTVIIPEGTNGCVGDCNGDGVVQVNEVIIGVNIALERAQLSTCPSFDVNGNGRVEVNELITAVNNLLRGCPTP